MSPEETAGAVIGRDHLLQKIGEGAMGEVWLAEQREHVRRRVALKLVKSGMNSREIIERFESGRQALALMDHPTIAKVLDAGSTLHGAPYFVMEYVAGVPITAYRDNHRLSTREGLDLFMHVSEGVQHAHQKAIIHRDLKPSNILVTEVDGRPGKC
jgi:non-specific serine/threonine protein kinase/serine/threonine-protein kinase